MTLRLRGRLLVGGSLLIKGVDCTGRFGKKVKALTAQSGKGAHRTAA